jgi:hypothetical protein
MKGGNPEDLDDLRGLQPKYVLYVRYNILNTGL